MKVYCTELKAIDPRDGELKNWCGPNVPAYSFEEAEIYVRENMGWLVVTGELISEIPTKGKTFDPEWAKEINYWEIGKADAIKFGRFILKRAIAVFDSNLMLTWSIDNEQMSTKELYDVYEREYK